jgi:putative FmdB family regulatory protein
MPLYEYRCEDCGVRFERRQHINDEPVKVCPECGGQVHRLIHPVGVIFKGSGFYVTDNRAKSSTAVPGSTKKSSETSTEGSSTGDSSKKSQSAGESSADGKSSGKDE